MGNVTASRTRPADLKVIDHPLSDLHGWERNPRRIRPERLEQLKRMLEDSPEMLRARPLIALPDGTVIAGNQRLAAAVALGWMSIPCVTVDLDEQTAIEWAFRDNNPVGETDDDLAAVLLAELDAGGRPLDLTGFAPVDVEAFLRRTRVLGDPDVAPAAPAVPRSVRGEVYELGPHRLMCGDACDADDVAVLLDGEMPHLCVTDPPYGVNYDPKWRNVEAAKGNLAYAARRVGDVLNDDRADWREAWELFPGDVIYSWHPPGATSLVHAGALQDSGFALRMQIIWAKSNFPIGRGDYHVRHEPCWYAVREGKSARRTRDRTQTTLWEINLDKNVEGGHSTQKPVECMARPIRNHDSASVYDPFVGSGTTLVAAELLERRCFAMELEPRYADVVRQRYADFVGDPRWEP